MKPIQQGILLLEKVEEENPEGEKGQVEEEEDIIQQLTEEE
jgi:hypothetical protein